MICTICARGGSIGVPQKNIALVDGKPLICHTIEQAMQLTSLDAIAVSSDDPKILEVARAAGVTHLVERPAELATSSAPKIPVIRHCVKEVEARLERKFDTILDLDPTSPLREVGDIKAAWELFREKNASIVITASPSRKNPYFNMVECDDNGVARLCKPLSTGFSGRQQCPKVYDMNASIYVWSRSALFELETLWTDKTFLLEMPEERSVDIDSPLDLAFVQFLFERRREGRLP